jgi:hypothetical protein
MQKETNKLREQLTAKDKKIKRIEKQTAASEVGKGGECHAEARKNKTTKSSTVIESSESESESEAESEEEVVVVLKPKKHRTKQTKGHRAKEKAPPVVESSESESESEEEVAVTVQPKAYKKRRRSRDARERPEKKRKQGRRSVDENDLIMLDRANSSFDRASQCTGEREYSSQIFKSQVVIAS